MKKVFLFLVSALVCGIMTSCSDDDDSGVALTDLRVEPATVSKPVGETQLIKVTVVPDNATGVTYTWTTSNDKVATVSDGLITITGIGEAKVTVASGTIKKDVTVTGTLKGITVKDANGAIVGTYPFTDGLDPVEFTLTATVDPATSDIKPEWSVDVNTVTVAASADGLSAKATISGEGTAVVSVTAGGVTATYTISTTSLLETAKGYWTFDNPDDLTEATIGNALEFNYFERRDNGPIIPADGPTADNKAAFVPIGAWVKCLHGLEPNGAEGATRVNEFTFMFDVKVPNYAVYHTLIHANLGDPYNSSLYLKSRGRVGISGPDLNTPDGTVESDKWYRFIFTAKIGETGFYNYYWNGELLKENLLTSASLGTDHPRHTLDPAGVWLLFDAPPEDGGNGDVDDNDIYVASIALWDYALTAAEVAALGEIEVDE
jgi:hypothetical protein